MTLAQRLTRAHFGLVSTSVLDIPMKVLAAFVAYVLFNNLPNISYSSVERV